MEKIRCTVERIVYQNDGNGYTVIRCYAKGFSDLITLVGSFPELYVGTVLDAEGEWVSHPKYGSQFRADKWEEVLPATVKGIQKYLGSGLIKGVGPAFAARIVKKFGADTLDVIENTPERLGEVSGIGRTRIEQIKESWQEQREIKNVMIFLQEHNVSCAHATKIYREYGADSIKVVQENPYRLADDIQGIGFRTADTIALKLGFEPDCLFRLRSGITYAMNALSDEGHCFATRDQLTDSASELLGVDRDSLQPVIDDMTAGQGLIEEDGDLYLPVFHYCETECAKRISSLAGNPPVIRMDTEAIISDVKKGAGIEYDAVQEDAIRTALSSRVMVLTGGPGTGKTTITKGIIKAYTLCGKKVMLAAPTGRAAKRMSEATGMEAKTVHRLLEYKPPEGFQRKADNPLDTDVLIVDECSMIGIILMYSLLRALTDDVTLVMVGDADQLPSVEAGNVLKDIIASGSVPVVRLTKIFRQAQESRIVTNAHRINEGKMPDTSGGKGSDFFFIEADGGSVCGLVTELCRDRLPGYYGADPMNDIQVLTPMKRGDAGVDGLNVALQEALNPAPVAMTHGGTGYRTGDKVMQLKNDYDRDVYNGDIGVISRIDPEEGELTAVFDGREVKYDRSGLDELTLAYATTVHKAQGSEYPIVVMPVTYSHRMLLQRGLVYTAVTRAKKVLVMVGDRKALSYAVKNDKTVRRNTHLAERLAALRKPAAGAYRAAPQTRPGRGGDAFGDLFDRLSASSFRSRFFLSEKDIAYVKEKGLDVIRGHAGKIIAERLSPAEPQNDGKQTPMSGHPVFVAQHATGTCCRDCLYKWHGIPKGRELTREEQGYAADVVTEWIRRETERRGKLN